MKKKKQPEDDGILKSYTDEKWFIDMYKDGRISLGETKYDWDPPFNWPYIMFTSKQEMFEFIDFIFALREKMMEEEGYFDGQ